MCGGTFICVRSCPRVRRGEWGICCAIVRRTQPAAGSMVCGDADCSGLFQLVRRSERVRSDAVALPIVKAKNDLKGDISGERLRTRCVAVEWKATVADRRCSLAPRRHALEPQLPSVQRSCFLNVGQDGRRLFLQHESITWREQRFPPSLVRTGRSCDPRCPPAARPPPYSPDHGCNQPVYVYRRLAALAIPVSIGLRLQHILLAKAYTLHLLRVMHALLVYALALVYIYIFAFLVRLFLSWMARLGEPPEIEHEYQLGQQIERQPEQQPRQQLKQQPEEQQEDPSPQCIRHRILPSSENGQPLDR